MRRSRIQKKKATPTIKHELHLVSDDFSNLREQLGTIEFHSGFAWATDAHVAVKISTAEIFSVQEDVAGKLNGYSIKREFWKMIKGKQVIISDEGKILFSPDKNIYPCIEVPMEKVTHSRTLEEMISGVMPDSKEFQEIKEIGINPKMLSNVCRVLRATHNNVRLSFTAPNKAITVQDNSEDKKHNRGIVMPVMIFD